MHELYTKTEWIKVKELEKQKQNKKTNLFKCTFFYKNYKWIMEIIVRSMSKNTEPMLVVKFIFHRFYCSNTRNKLETAMHGLLIGSSLEPIVTMRDQHPLRFRC